MRGGNKHRTNGQIVRLLRRRYGVAVAYLRKCAPEAMAVGLGGLLLPGPTRPLRFCNNCVSPKHGTSLRSEIDCCLN
jgi:hypothetical protein